jgi:hypothetical protein
MSMDKLSATLEQIDLQSFTQRILLLTSDGVSKIRFSTSNDLSFKLHQVSLITDAAAQMSGISFEISSHAINARQEEADRENELGFFDDA